MTRLADWRAFSGDLLLALPGVVAVHGATPVAGHVLLVAEEPVAQQVGALVEAMAPINTVVHVQVEGHPPIAAWHDPREAARAQMIARKRRDVLWAFRAAAMAAEERMDGRPGAVGNAPDDGPGIMRRGGWLTCGEVHAIMGGSDAWKIYPAWLDGLVAEGVLERRSPKRRMWRLTGAGWAELAGADA